MEINRNGSRLFYTKAGNGPNLLLFHGFGQDHSAFEPLVSAVSDQHTCYSFDLFFHGQSTWTNEGTPLTLETWKPFIDAFIQQEKITHFSILGFSIGARLALATSATHPEFIRQLILLAPDGIGNHPFFTIATAFRPNRLLFRRIASSEHFFPTLASLLRRLGIVQPGLLRFAESQMKTKANRLRVFNTWTLFRHLNFKSETLAMKIIQHNIQVFIFLAANDHLINEKKLQKFVSPLDQPVIEKLDCRHSQLITAVAAAFYKLITGRSENRP